VYLHYLFVIVLSDVKVMSSTVAPNQTAFFEPNQAGSEPKLK